MKKYLNIKKKKISKKNIMIIFFLIIMIFIANVFYLLERKYLYIEKFAKNGNEIISSFIIRKVYSNNNLNNSVIKEKNNYLKQENNELKKMLKLKVENERFLTSYVINHSSIYWFNKLEISCDDNYKIGYPVINSDGLIGFISKVSKKNCEVNLLTNVNKNNMIPVSFSNDGTGMLYFYDKNKNLYKVTSIITKDEIKVGDSVTYLDYLNHNNNGLIIGKVKKINESYYGLTKEIIVEPSANVFNTMFVITIGEE